MQHVVIWLVRLLPPNRAAILYLFFFIYFIFCGCSEAVVATKTGSTVNQFQAKLRQEQKQHSVIIARVSAKIKRATRKKDAENKMHLNWSSAKEAKQGQISDLHSRK